MDNSTTASAQAFAELPGDRSRRRAHWIVAGLALTAVVWLYWPTFLSMEAVWRRDMTYTHCYLVPAIVGVLLWRMRGELAACTTRVSFSGIAVCAVLAPIWILATMLHVQFLQQAIVVALIPAVVWAVLGDAVLRQAFFPLGFLAFAVPFGEALVPSLMNFTAEFTIHAVRLFGVPIHANERAFSLPSGDFEVVKACSGIRYLIASLAIGTLFAWLNYRSWRRRLMFVALSIVVPIIANGLRAFGIVMIAHLSEMKYAVGFDHLVYGWLFFGIVIGILIWFGSKFREEDSGAAISSSAAVTISGSPRRLVLACVCVGGVLAAGPLGAEVWRTSLSGSESTLTSRPSLPMELPGWSGPGKAELTWRPVFAESGAAVHARYSSSNGAVILFIRDYTVESEGENELTTATLVHDDQLEWRMSTSRPDVPPPSSDIQVHDITGSRGDRFRLWMWYTVDAESVSGTLRMKWRQLRAMTNKRHPRSAVFAVLTSASDPNEADKILKTFVEANGTRLGLVKADDR